MSWDDGLSNEQRQAASIVGERVRLLAGPGTGKTRTITNRVAYLQEHEGVAALEILVLTFGRAAANELRERLTVLGLDPPLVQTLHGFALRQLLRNGAAPELPEPILIADDFDQRWVIEEDLKRILNRPVRDVQNSFQDLSADWETLNADTEEWELAHPDPQFLGAWREHREIFGYTLRSELVYRVKRALLEDPDFELEQRFRHVIIDEYQDLNRCELAVVEALASTDVALYVAGDDDQSIYGFRHAFPQGIRDFTNTYRGSADLELEVCHRCDKEILRLALAVAALDPRRVPKNLHSASNDNGVVKVLSFSTGAAEARGIARICKHLIEDEGVPPGEILILQRSDYGTAFSTPVLKRLQADNVPAKRQTNPLAALDQNDGRQVVCVMRLLMDEHDSLAWSELLDLRTNGVGPTPLVQVYDLARERGLRFSDALMLVHDDPTVIAARNRRTLAHEVATIQRLLTELEPLLDEPLDVALDPLLTMTLNADDVEEFITLFSSLVGDEESPTLRLVFQRLQAVRDWVEKLEEQEEADAVRLMTMHAAKGLTASAVIIPYAEDEVIPGRAETDAEEGDERRLLYVSMTRPRKYLYVTYTTRRAGQQQHAGRRAASRSLTRFLQGLVSPEGRDQYLR